jgi:hypothetical protein
MAGSVSYGTHRNALVCRGTTACGPTKIDLRCAAPRSSRQAAPIICEANALWRLTFTS